MQTSLSFGISGVNPEGCAIWLNVASVATRGMDGSAACKEASGASRRVVRSGRADFMNLLSEA
jgi:hypothetical protein